MDSPASTPRGGAPDDAFMSSNGLTGDLNGLGQQQQQPGQTHAGPVGEPNVREDSDRDSDDDDGDRRKPAPGGSSGRRSPPTHQPGVPPAHVQPRPPQQPHLQLQQHQKAASPAPHGSPGPGNNRYFILKSYNHENIQRAVADGVWATQRHNEVKLNEAFSACANVFLIFSVNMSGHFQGYARMTSSVGGTRARPHGWLGNAAVGTLFGIEWRRVVDLPFSATESMMNPLNEGKPVRIARDGQELPPALGREMVNLFEKFAQQMGVAKPVPPPRPPAGGVPMGAGSSMVGSQPRPPPPRPPGVPPGMRPGSGGTPGGALGMGSMPMADPNAIVFNEMGVPVGNLGSLGMGMNGGLGQGGMGLVGGMGMPGSMGMANGMPGMLGQGGMQPFAGGMGMMGQGGGGHMVRNDMMGGGLGMGMGMGMRPNGGMPPGAGLGGGMGLGAGMGMGMGTGFGAGMAGMGAYQGGRMNEARRSPLGSERRRSTRSRSRSKSPRRHKRSRSRSRERGSSKGRSSSRPNLLQMSYDEYLAHFERVRRQRASGRPDSAQGNGVGTGGAMTGANTMGGSMMGVGNGMPGSGQQMMSEEAYVEHCRLFTAQKGVPFNEIQVRQYYRGTRAQMGL